MNSPHTRSVLRYWTSPFRRLCSRLLYRRSSNVWMLLAGLALGGWFIDSLLVGFRLHELPDSTPTFHLWHLWYVPPLLVAGLLLIRRHRPELMQPATTLPVFDTVARSLPPAVKALAFHVVRSETQAALLTFLQRYPALSLTASDLAGTVERELDDVELALRQLETLDLVERQLVYGLTFYRLTQDEGRRQQLREVAAWQESWRQQAQGLMQVVGRDLSSGRTLGRRSDTGRAPRD